MKNSTQMKKIAKASIQSVLLILLLTLTGIRLNAQTGWELVYSSSSWYYDMSFVPGSDGTWQTGWVITTDAEILKTTDGGDTWTVITQTETTQLNGICFVDENIGYASSAQGEIIKSTDGGLNWTTVYTGSWFGQIAFKDALNGSVAGNPNNMYTNDGGVTWNDATAAESYGRMDYGSGDTYYGSGILASAFGKSVDNGQNWTNTTLDHIPVVCEFYDENIGVTGGDSWTIMHTTDGGVNWTESQLNGGSGDFLCAGFFDADTIYAGGSQKIYKSTDAGSTWVQDTSFTGVNFRSMFVTGANVVFAGGEPGQIWRKIGFPPFSANFEADATTTCAGSTVDFTDLSFGPITDWNWTFEGGTPSTSSDQNPTVTYNTPGVYDVELTITSSFGTDTEVEMDYITVLETPGQATTPLGETALCSGFDYIYSTDEVSYATDYEWEIIPSTAGEFVVSAYEATLEVAEDFTGDFSLKVRATNLCGDGDWSPALEGTVSESPEEYELEGGGTFCEGGEGVEITLNGSQSGVNYELFLDDESTGITVEGTGSEISFGMITEEGYYTAEGSNSNCMQIMSGQLLVEVENLPEQATTPTGPIAICNEPSSAYESTGAEGADSYNWTLSPEFAGAIEENGLEATVAWDSEFSGIALISVAGVNNCGEGDFSESLEVTVGATLPVINGEEIVCDFSTETYEVEDHDGSNYLWTVNGGVIIEGQGTYLVTIDWNGEGNGTIEVEEETVDGCTGVSEEFVVTIDDCTGIGENGEETSEQQIDVYPNPATDFLIVKSTSIIRHIKLINIDGKSIIEDDQTGNTLRLNTQNIDRGLYLLKVVTDDQIAVKRVIID